MATKKENITCGEGVPVGGVLLAGGDIEFNTGRQVLSLRVRNTGDRPIQVGSHYHFYEVNRHLSFERDKALGYHLNIPATTAIRFEPGDERTVELVAFGGRRRIVGFAGAVNGWSENAIENGKLNRRSTNKTLIK